jgi:hypothetical protein
MNSAIQQNQSKSGSFRIIILLVIAVIACFWYGGQGVYTALQNRRPVQLGVGDLAKSKPSAHWLALTNCDLAIMDAAYKTVRSKYAPATSGRITEAFIPLRAPGQTLDDPCYAVLATEDPGILGQLEELRQVKNDADLNNWIAKNKNNVRPHRDVTGLVKFGVETGMESGKLGGLQRNLAPGYIVLAEGKKPNLTNGLGLILLGFVIAGGMVLAARSNSETTTEEV